MLGPQLNAWRNIENDVVSRAVRPKCTVCSTSCGHDNGGCKSSSWNRCFSLKTHLFSSLIEQFIKGAYLNYFIIFCLKNVSTFAAETRNDSWCELYKTYTKHRGQVLLFGHIEMAVVSYQCYITLYPLGSKLERKRLPVAINKFVSTGKGGMWKKPLLVSFYLFVYMCFVYMHILIFLVIHLWSCSFLWYCFVMTVQWPKHCCLTRYRGTQLDDKDEAMSRKQNLKLHLSITFKNFTKWQMQWHQTDGQE